MSDEPIVLPGLAAERRGPSAAVCASGHLLSWNVEPSAELSFCPKCGDRMLFACPACNTPFRADPEMLQWVPYYSHCMACGKPHPWIDAEITRAKRTLEDNAEVEKWDDAVKARALELLDDIIADRAASSYVTAALNWFGQRGAESATPALLDAVDRLGSAELKKALRPSFPGQF